MRRIEAAVTTGFNLLCSYSCSHENFAAKNAVHSEWGSKSNQSPNLKTSCPIQYWESNSYWKLDCAGIDCNFSGAYNGFDQHISLLRSLETKVKYIDLGL
jgi:hypothetical protein